MIKVNVISNFKGKIAVRDKYLKEALRNKEDILIVSDNKTMLIPFKEITKRIVGKSAKPVPDYFSNDSHYLIYFKFIPTFQQKQLL